MKINVETDVVHTIGGNPNVEGKLWGEFLLNSIVTKWIRLNWIKLSQIKLT